MEKLRVEYPSSALRESDYPQKIDEARAFCEKQGWDFGVQIHNTAPVSQIQQLADLGIPLSFHAPLGSEYFMNLAAEDDGPARDSQQRTIDIIAQTRPAPPVIAVFHGFLMTDQLTYTFHENRSYDQALEAAWRKDLCLPGLRLCGDFFDTEEYHLRFSRVKERLGRLNQNGQPIVWCIENDYPCYSAGLLLAEHLLPLNQPLCLDVSHLWVSALLLRRDFAEETARLAWSGRVRCVHLHASTTPRNAPAHEYRDGHRHLHTPNEMDLPGVVRTLRGHRIAWFVLETYEADLTDLQTLADWL